MENEAVHKDDEGAQSETDNYFAERRPSIMKLQGMLRRVSQSPFHKQYRTLVPSTSDSSETSMNNSHKNQGKAESVASGALEAHSISQRNGMLDRGAWNPFHYSSQNGVNGSLARANPFYTHFVESSSKTINMEDIRRETSKEPGLTTILAHPPEFQSSPLDSTPDTENNRTKSPDPRKNLFQTSNHGQTPNLFQTSTIPQNTSPIESPSHGTSLNSAHAFKATPSQPQDLTRTLRSNRTVPLQVSKGDNLFQVSTREDASQDTSTKDLDLFHTPPNSFRDPVHPSSNKEEDLFQSRYSKEADLFHTPATKGADLFQAPTDKGENSSAKENYLFHVAPTKENDLFHTPPEAIEDVFSTSSARTDVPFPRLAIIDPFQHSRNMPDPFKSSPFEPFHPFKDPLNGSTDIFQHVPSKTQGSFQPLPSTSRNDTLNTTPNHNASEATYSTPSFNSPPEMKSDVFSSSSVDKSQDLFKTTPSAHIVNPPDKSLDIVLTTPRGTKHDILQPTPFSQAGSVSMSPIDATNELENEHMTIFKRPPKPLPRRKPPRPANPIVPEVTSPKTPPELAPKPAPKPFPKPVPHIRQTAQAISKPEEVADDAVFEDILLIGQERCVEDWPEDSPQLDPHFKPSGTLRLRRESMRMKSDSDGGSGDDQYGTGKHGKKKGRTFRVASFLSRRSPKDTFSDDVKDRKSETLPRGFKHESKDEDGNNKFPMRSKDGLLEDDHLHKGTHFFPAGEDEEKNGMDGKPKKPLKAKVSKLLRRASTASYVQNKAGEETMNGHFPQGLKERVRKDSETTHRWSEGNTLDEGLGEEEEDEHAGSDNYGIKRKKRVTVKFVPRRGFAITVEKTQVEPKGAHGYTPGRSPKDGVFEDGGGATGYTTPHSTSEATHLEEECSPRGRDLISPGIVEDKYHNEVEHCRPKKSTKLKLPHVGRGKSKDDMLDDHSPQKTVDPFSGGEMEDEEQNGIEDCKPKKHFKPKRPRWKSKTTQETSLHESSPNQYPPRRVSNGVFLEDDVPHKGADLFSPQEMYEDEQNEMADYKPKKSSKLKGHKKRRAKNKAMEYQNPPGATSKDYYLSEAAEAEWLAAQIDERLAAGLEEGEDGDTDSLMEWWNTVEQWDEVPSDDEDKIMKMDETKSFTTLADKVYRGLRVFNKVFTERAEILWQSVITLHAIADDISAFHKKAKIASITGGTTTAVGGVAAIAGLALAPLTFGASLIVTAVGVGVATAGGIASASATISDNVNNMHDRKKVEAVLHDYEAHLLDLGKILHFVNEGLYRLRGHPLLRAGTQHYSEDWEIRRAVQIISLVDRPVMRAAEITDEAIVSVHGLFKGMDKFFIKDSRELKKGCKKEGVGQIKEVANVLNDGLVELNAIREELQDASGNL